jgi:hypothetical protein
MPAFIRNPKDFWTGVVFIAFGIAFLLIAQGYPLGSARRMGPAYFPTMLSAVLILVGIAAAVRSFISPGAPITRAALKPMALIALGTIAFGLLVRSAGVVAAIVVLVLISAYASMHFSWRAAGLLGIGLAIFCVAVFAYGLGLSIPIVGPLLGGG